MKALNIGQRYLSLLLVLVIIFTMCPRAFAEAEPVAEDEAGQTKYYSISDAWSAAKGGKVIKMLKDWSLGDRLVLDDEESATIDMNGMRIDRKLGSYTSNGEVIYLDEKANLTLKSTATATKQKFTGWETETIILK